MKIRKFWLGSAGFLTLVGAVLLLRPSFEDAGCACVPPPTLEEINTQVKVANKGDYEDSIRATGWVWQAYVLRGDAKNAELWKRRVISIREPNALYHMADDASWDAQKSRSASQKMALLKEAVSLLERAYPRREMLESVSRSVFVDQLRATKASVEVLEDGVEKWITKAQSGDATAAHNVARYYFWADLNQDKRSYWEKRAAELGDPSFAQRESCCWRQTKEELFVGKNIIQISRGNEAAWANAGDKWMRSILEEELDNTAFQIDSRLERLNRS